MMFLKKILLTEKSEPNYLYLLIALFIMITFPALSVVFGHPYWVFHISYTIVILTSILYSYEKKEGFSFGLSLGILALLSYWIEVMIDSDSTQTINLFISFIFFTFLLFRITFVTLDEENVTINTVYAVSVGYFLLGMMGFWLLTFLDIMVPNSFIGNFSSYRGYDLIYFSFVTLTSVGYGDIQPLNPEGKSICLIIGIIGQLYVSFTIAMIVGKYISQKSK